MVAYEALLQEHHELVHEPARRKRKLDHVRQKLLESPSLQLPLSLQKRTELRPEKLTKLLVQLTTSQPELQATLWRKQRLRSPVWRKELLRELPHHLETRGCLPKRLPATWLASLVLKDLQLQPQPHAWWQLLQVVALPVLHSQARWLHDHLAVWSPKSTTHALSLPLWLLPQTWFEREQAPRQL